jgi:hypothetical protein
LVVQYEKSYSLLLAYNSMLSHQWNNKCCGTLKIIIQRALDYSNLSFTEEEIELALLDQIIPHPTTGTEAIALSHEISSSLDANNLNESFPKSYVSAHTSALSQEWCVCVGTTLVGTMHSLLS